MSDFIPSQPPDNRKQRKQAPVAEGSRLSVFCPSEQRYFDGTLVGKRNDDQWKIEYGDRDGWEWILLSKTTYRVLYPVGSPEAKEQDKRKALLTQIEPGSRVKVYWKPYDNWFEGTVSKIELGKSDEYLIQYDGQDETWENLFVEKFELLDVDDNASTASHSRDLPLFEYADRDAVVPRAKVDPRTITAGTRISVYFEFKDGSGGQFYDGTVTSDMVIKRNPKRLITIYFDDNETHDVGLVNSDFRILSSAKSSKGSKKRYVKDSQKVESHPPRSSNNAHAAKKQKLSQNDLPDERQRKSKVKMVASNKQSDVACAVLSHEIPALPSATDTESTFKAQSTPTMLSSANRVASPSSVITFEGASDDADPCPLCKKQVMERPRSLECCHIFCRECIVAVCKNNCSCPICNRALGDKPKRLYAKEEMPEAFRSLVATDVLNGTSRTFPSASAATQALSIDIPASDILIACGQKHLKERLVVGYAWELSPHDTPSTAEEESKSVRSFPMTSTKGKVIERLCLQTGKVLESYASLSEAARQLNIQSTGIGKVARGQRLSAGGFSFRCKDAFDAVPEESTKVIIAKHRPNDKKIVERLCMKTGKVLETYPSVSMAATQLKISRICISKAARGEQHSAGGFSFRFKNSHKHTEESSLPFQHHDAD